MSKPICYVMVGLPASGKSTRVSDITRMDPDVFVYSTDNILERIAEQLGKTYDEVFEKHIKSAQTEADIWLADAMKHKLDIIWDQTNLTVKKRRSIIDRMVRAGYAVDCECFVKPETVEDVSEWNRRIHSREGKTIPEHIITNMVKTYVVPSVDEGFESVTYWNIYSELTGIDYGVIHNE
jgi:predicted kinase